MCTWKLHETSTNMSPNGFKLYKQLNLKINLIILFTIFVKDYEAVVLVYL